MDKTQTEPRQNPDKQGLRVQSHFNGLYLRLMGCFAKLVYFDYPKRTIAIFSINLNRIKAGILPQA